MIASLLIYLGTGFLGVVLIAFLAMLKHLLTPTDHDSPAPQKTPHSD